MTMAEVLEKPLYQRDYYAWTREQAARLRELAQARSHLPLDLENLAEEVESLGRSEYRTVRSQLQRVVEYLLKLEWSPAKEPRDDCRASVDLGRDELRDDLSASLRADAQRDLEKYYGRARREAARSLKKHGEAEATAALPPACPYTFEQIIDEDWYPPNRHGIEGDEI